MDAYELVAKAQRITVLTGAGISTESGIPDFRGPQGLWTTQPAAQAIFDIDSYLADPAVRIQAWKQRLITQPWTVEPNAGHHALVELERQNRLCAIVTQNIDGLHQKAGSSPSLVHELHGTALNVVCMSCDRRLPMAELLPRLEAGEDDPPCELCGGILKSATVSFGQSLDPDVMDAALDAARDCDLFMAIGTSLQVYPAAGLCDVAQGLGARLIIINAEPTPYDAAADALDHSPIGQVLPGLVSV
ncbi:NAD-dependent deacylase [Kribbella sp. NBC_01245]|uniref:SIR2 family NAD-dependent protein deacylase n=1 Tax=Kribbella sp. NBC_01245 TaxID=2903578 RepID=UPI002E2BE03B|nr:NAD-dependent deacylase [Kribbella sp. NBC_01245]